MQEAQGDVEGRAAPHLQAVEVVQPVRDEVRDRQHVVGAHARGEQRLMRIAEGCVGSSSRFCSRVHFGEPLGAELLEELSRARAAARTRRARESARGRMSVGLRFARHFLVPVDDHLAEIVEQLRRAVLARRELEELRRVVEESRGGLARLEGRVVDDVLEKRDVGLHAANAELAQRAIHALARFLESSGPRR